MNRHRVGPENAPSADTVCGAIWPSPAVQAALRPQSSDTHLRRALKRAHGSGKQWQWPADLTAATGTTTVDDWEQDRRRRAAKWAEDRHRSATGVAPADPEFVLLAGDWHGNARWAVTCLLAADRLGARVVAQVGDFGVWPGGAGQHYLDVVSDAADRLDLSVVFVDGNHEDFDQLERTPVHSSGWRVLRPRLLHAPRGHTWTWGTQRWVAVGGATSLDRAARTPHVDWWPQEEITSADLSRLRTTMTVIDGPVDVLLTHDAPSAVRIPGLDPHAFPAAEVHRAEQHRLQLDAVVERVRPALLAHGHFHRIHTEQSQLPDGHRYTSLCLDTDGAGAGSLHLLDTRRPLH